MSSCFSDDRKCLRSCFGTIWLHSRNIASAGWQVTLCDPIWHVSFHSRLLYPHEPLYCFCLLCSSWWCSYYPCSCLVCVILLRPAGRRYWSIVAAARHGTQLHHIHQQMWAVSHCQLMLEAEHILFIFVNTNNSSLTFVRQGCVCVMFRSRRRCRRRSVVDAGDDWTDIDDDVVRYVSSW